MKCLFLKYGCFGIAAQIMMHRCARKGGPKGVFRCCSCQPAFISLCHPCCVLTHALWLSLSFSENSTRRSRLHPVSMVSGWVGERQRENYARLLQNLAKYSLHLIIILHHTCYLFNPILQMLYIIRPGLWS
jgi:hypothetical protein